MRSVEIQVYRGSALIEAQRFEEQEVIKIGRLPSAHLRLVDPTVARVHAVLEIVGERVHLIVADPSASTSVGGRAIVGEVDLGDGAPLVIGPFRVEVELRAQRPEIEAITPTATPRAAPTGASSAPLAPSLTGAWRPSEAADARRQRGRAAVAPLLVALIFASLAALLVVDAGGQAWQRCMELWAMSSWSCTLRVTWTPPLQALPLLLGALGALALGLRGGRRRPAWLAADPALWRPSLAESGC